MKQLSLLLSTVCLLGSSFLLAHGNLADVVASGSRSHALDMIGEGTNVNAQQSDGTSALLYAVYEDDLELVTALAEAGAEVNQRNDYGASTMGEAAMVGNPEILKVLLEHGANANLTNLEGETPLMVVARAGNIDAAKLLLEYGAELDAQEHWGGQTATMWAAAQQHPAMLALLIEAGADIDMKSTARNWDLTMMNEPRPKDMNNGGFSPLHYAAREGCTDCISVLAQGGADLNAVDPDRVSPLNLALINMHFETALALIEAGADVNQWDIFGRAPLYNAIDLNTMPVGGRPDLPSPDLTTGFDVARSLLAKGANPNMQLKMRPPYRNAVFDRGSDNPLSNGATPLTRAARSADVASVKLLLEHGALVDLPNASGHTPLLVVSGIQWPADPTRGRFKTESESIETLRVLLEAGADINAVTGDPAARPLINIPGEDRSEGYERANGRSSVYADGQTGLHAAAKIGWNDIIEFLIDNGAAQEVRDMAGRSPFDLAMGRYSAGFLQPPPEPLFDTAVLLQEACMADDNCVMNEPADLTNPTAIQ
ncbi:MAG: ankyrin repeat domain-containing protein [Gammaproteobacteria bacterium]|nr:ankyrin repeat domain-containing protein [Gammaproteobacteria bacterium]